MVLKLPLSFCPPPPLECILVQSGLVHHLLHPRDNLLYQTSQVLQENEVL